MAELKRSLGFFSLLFYSIGVIVGAGIYSVIGAAAGIAGEGLWISFAIGSIIALFTALSYAELATMFPDAGAEYIYLREAAPDREWLRFLTGFVLLLAAATTGTTVAIAFGGYVQEFIDFPSWLAALVLLIFCTALNIVGIKQSTWVNITFTVIELLGLALVIWWGLNADIEIVPSFRLHSGVFSATAVIFFVYLGFEKVANLAEETCDPGRHLPKAIYLSLFVTTALYIVVSIVVTSLVPPGQLAKSGHPLSDAVRGVAPEGAGILAAIALFSTANTALITMIGGSRMLFSMSRDGEAPMALSRLLPGRQSPYAAAILLLIVGAAFLPFGDIAVVANISSFGSLVAFATVNIALIILAYKRPKAERPFRAWRIAGVPVTAAVGLLSIGLLVSQFDLTTYLVGLVTVAVGGVAFYFFKGSQRARNAAKQ
jgi:amino acid transporter